MRDLIGKLFRGLRTACLHLRTSAANLRADSQGNILFFGAAAIVVIVGLVGGAVDMSRTYRVQNRLQNACDAGALAGRRAVSTSGYDTAAQAQAQKFFAVNFDATQQGVTASSFTSSSDDAGATVIGSASATVPMILMQLFGKDSITVSASCTATEGIGNVDVTFVLDTTGSMASQLSGTSTTRLAALQSAMKSFYTTLYSATNSTSARVRYAFVPYSTTVNVGKLLYGLSPSYLADSWGYQSRVARFDTTVNVSYSGTSVTQSKTAYYSTPNSSPASYSGSYASLPACIAAMPSDTAWSNTGSSSSSTTTTKINNSNVSTKVVTQPQIMTSYTCVRTGDAYYVYYYNAYRYYYTYTYSTTATASTPTTTTSFNHFDYKMAKYDTSAFKLFNSVSAATGTSGASVSATWTGCIEERHTVSDSSFAYSSSSGLITPTTALDLDIDSPPASNDDKTKWAPMWPAVSFYRTTSSNGSSQNNSSVSVNGAQASTPCPAAAAALAELSQSDFNTYAASLTASGNTYHDIGMLWGARLSSTTGIFSSIVNQKPSNGETVSRHLIFMTDGTPQANSLIEQAYGIEYHDKRITDDGSTSDDDRHEARFRAICDAVKAKGIRIWVIGFTTSLTSDLSYCASDSSSYTASDASGLNTAFQNIAKQIGELRIYK